MNTRTKIEDRFESFGHFVARWRFLLLVLVLIFAASLSSRAPGISFDASTDSFLRHDDPAKLLYDDFRDRFGRDEVVILAIRSEDVLAPEFLERLAAFHEELENEVPHLEEVRSLINARVTKGDEDQLLVEDLLEEWPEDPESWQEIREFVLQNPFYQNLLISSDAQLTTIMVETSAFSSVESNTEMALQGFGEEELEDPPSFLTSAENEEIRDAVMAISERFQGVDFRIDLTGAPLLQAELVRGMQSNMVRFVALMLVIITTLLFFIFRRISGVLLPLLVVAPAVSGTVGAMAITGTPLSAPAQILPSMLLAVGVGAAVHILTIFYQRLDEGANKEDAMAGALRHSGLPVCMSSLTTAAGLLSFVAAELQPVASIGVFAPIGICLALVYCLVLLPALIFILPIRARKPRPNGPRGDRIERILISTGEFSIRNAKPILVVTAALIAISLVGASKITFGHDILTWLAEGHRFRTATAVFDAHLEGSMSLEVVVDTGRENGIQEPDVLLAMDEIARELEGGVSKNGISVGKATSLADVVKEIHQALNGNDERFYRIPDDRELIAQELLLFENTGSDEIERLVDSQFSMTRFSVRVPYVDPTRYKPFNDSTVTRFQEALGPDVDIRATGFLAVMSRTASALLESMIRSYMLALIIITPLMILLIGSLRTGLASMVPNLTPILITLGLMGWYGLVIDAFTMMIGGIAIGLAVDDTIHYMHNFRRYFGQYGDVRRANSETLRTTGRALLITSIVLSSGFFIFVFAGMENLVRFGLLTSFTIASAFLIDILVSPALMSLAYGEKEK